MDEEYDWFMEMHRSEKFLPENVMLHGHLYYISARNAHLGIWLTQCRGFLISRTKFKRNYLFVEYHWDTGDPYGTVKPFIDIELAQFDGQIIDAIAMNHKHIEKLKGTAVVLKYLNDKIKEVPFLWGKERGLVV